MVTMTLVPGANHPIPIENITITVQLFPSMVSGAEVDISAFLLTAGGKVRGDGDMVFYGQPSPGKGDVALSGSGTGNATFTLNLTRLDADIEKIAFTATIHENKKTFAAFTHLTVNVQDSQGKKLLEAILPATGMIESALILGEVYLRQGQWKFRAVGQGFAGGLQPLAEHFGIKISPAPIAALPIPHLNPVAKTISAAKLTLDKSMPMLSLDKKPEGFGEISIQLTWHKGDPNPKKPGLMGSLFGTKTKGIALNMGCFYQMQNGTVGVIQALDNQFGALQQEPYIVLTGDDQNDAHIAGEWLRINGQYWSDFKRILLYAFISEGVPNWVETDAVVTIYVPNETPLEIRVSDGSSALNTCAILLLENIAGALQVNREVRYFSGHKAMDKHYREAHALGG